MAHLMKKVAVERLSVNELRLFRDDNLIAADRIIGIIAMGGLDGTHIEVFFYHRIQGREITHTLAGLETSAIGFVKELLVDFGAGLFEVGLVQIEVILDLQLGIDGIIGTFFLR